MKKILLILLSLATIIFVSCKKEDEEPTKTVKIEKWPDNVKGIQIISGYRYTDLKQAGTKEVAAPSDNITIHVFAADVEESESDTYAFYGNLTTDEKLFKVFVNCENAENKSGVVQSGYGDERLETNAISSLFTANVTCNADTLEISFENAPRKIAFDEIRLSDETIYSYFDVSGLREHVKAHLYDVQADGTGTFIKQVVSDGLYYVNKNSQVKLELWPETWYELNDSKVYANGVELAGSVAGGLFTYNFTENRNKGEVIKITGSGADLINDSDFINTVLISTSIIKKNDSDPDISSVTIFLTGQDYDGSDRKTASINVDGSELIGQWFMSRTDKCELSYLKSNGAWNSLNLDKNNDGSYSLMLWMENAKSYYTVKLKKTK
ncbi:hypothetical protein DYE50_00465 [Treponema ruminis]|uniref:Lipoprotein n=1 Tax=Treponema ruminis TaxID=744515 RepID=A0A7W8G774_9SPIR|nr:hypothetical protein [Treponema ruminis]MBB5225133.1 hypothetical protein [Treponema ruminis]QSI01054.1 hypothetical protein DYE50_00465 [Treponema ruminis]